MGKPSSAVKNRWNAKNYDCFRVTAPKGTKALMKETCARLGVSMNSVFAEALNRFLSENKK